MGFLIRKPIEIDRYTYIERLIPLFCVLVTYKNYINYYIYLAPSLTTLWMLAYNAITLVMLVAFVPLACKAIVNWNCYSELRPTLLIPICVVANIAMVIVQTGDASILSRGYRMMLAVETNDEFGYYFSQINTWFGNMASVMLLTFYARHRETIVKSVVACMSITVIPIVLIMMIHPEYLGVRQSTFEESEVVFGGGLWNIGVMGFGSLAWLGILLFKDMKKPQKWIAVGSVVLFLFVGIAGVSRTLILMAVFSAVFYFLLSRKDVGWLLKGFALVIAVGAFCILEKDLITSVLSRFTESDAFSENIRFDLWEEYLGHYKEYWLFGAPLGSAYNYYYEVNIVGHYYMPHSAPINFFVRFGFVAAAAYLLLLRNAFLIKTPFIRYEERICLLACGIAYITLAFINQTGYAEPIFYVMFGLVLAYSRTVEYEQRRAEK